VAVAAIQTLVRRSSDVSTPIPDAIRRFAEEPDGQLTGPPLPARRISTPSFVLMLSPSPTHATVSALRTSADALDDTIAETRALLREAGYTRAVWTLGPSCRPDGIAGLLLERGFFPPTRPPFEPEATAMALLAPPPPPPPGVVARVVRDFDEYGQAMRIAMEWLGDGDGDSSGWMEAASAYWNHPGGGARQTHLAFIDGQPVGFGFVAPGPSAWLLGGSGVRLEARRRGAYRALVAARWDAAVAMGKPALVIQAGAMSRPILDRCGFERVCELEMLEDPAIT
jgi:hypothetical protein